jgi:hypothetical protein
LQERYGRKTPVEGTWYPLPERAGPGHALLAWQTLGSSRHNITQTDALIRLIEQAHTAGTKKLLLSSEEFSWSYSKGTAPLQSALKGCNIHLVMTLSPIFGRALSSWQEMVKHGYTHSLADRPRFVLKRPGFRADLLRHFIIGLNPTRTSVIILNPNDPPDQLLKNFCSAVNLSEQITPLKFQKSNRSLSYIDVELIRQLNTTLQEATPDMDAERRAVLRRTLLTQVLASEAWRAQRPYIPSPLPEKVHGIIEQRAIETVEDIVEISKQSDNIKVFGDINDLLCDKANAGGDVQKTEPRSLSAE